jgi:hypothetical protein
MNNTGMDRTWSALVVLICGVILLGILFVAIVHGEIPGQMVNGIAIFRDADGVAAVPDSARLFVYRDGTLLRSSDTIAGGRITTSGSVLIWKYLLPSTSPDSARFTFIMRASGDGLSNDYFPCIPASFEPSPEVSSNTVASFQTGTASTSWAEVDSTDAGGIYKSGTGVTGAFVFATSNANGTGVIGYGTSTLGQYHLRVPLNPTVADTFYVSSWYQNAWLKSPTRVIK